MKPVHTHALRRGQWTVPSVDQDQHHPSTLVLLILPRDLSSSGRKALLCSGGAPMRTRPLSDVPQSGPSIRGALTVGTSGRLIT